MPIAYPYQIGADGRTACASHADYLRQLLEQLLFTIPGERVNRPEFGSGVSDLVFAPAAGELAIAAEALIRGTVQQWMGDWIELEEVHVESQEAVLRLTIRYVVTRTGERHREVIEREGRG